MKCLCVFLLRNQLKLKINRPTAKLLQVLNSISSTPCKTGENRTAAVLDMMVGAYINCRILLRVHVDSEIGMQMEFLSFKDRNPEKDVTLLDGGLSG